MRVTALLLVCGLVFWLGLGAPIPMATIRPLTPNASIPTFEQSRRIAAHAPEAPEASALRNEIIRTGRNLEASGCNEDARRQFAAAVIAVLRIDAEDFASERSGRPSTRGRMAMGEEAQDYIDAAIAQGVLRPADMPRNLPALQVLARVAQRSGNLDTKRFGCRT